VDIHDKTALVMTGSSRTLCIRDRLTRWGDPAEAEIEQESTSADGCYVLKRAYAPYQSRERL
jgi:hypothetical protein